jgi:hypothetical protein
LVFKKIPSLSLQWPEIFCYKSCSNRKKFNHHTIGDGMLLIIKFIATESILLPIVLQLKKNLLSHVSGFKSFDWQWTDLHHWIWRLNLVYLVIKCKLACQYSLSPLRCVGLVLFSTNHCHIPWEGGVKPLWVSEF